MEVVRSNETNRSMIVGFFKKIPLSEEISDELIDNTTIILDQDIIKSILSYECFDKIALIRFFIFQKELDQIWLQALIDEVVVKMKDAGIKKVLSFVAQAKMIPIFASFGFVTVDKNNLYLDETPLVKTDFNLNQVMVYTLD